MLRVEMIDDCFFFDLNSCSLNPSAFAWRIGKHRKNGARVALRFPVMRGRTHDLSQAEGSSRHAQSWRGSFLSF